MLHELFRLATDETKSDAVRLAAIRDWLDRAGITAKIEINVETNWQTIIAAVVTEVDDDQVPPLPDRYHPHDVVQGEVIDVEVIEEPGDEVHLVDGGEVFDLSSGARLKPSRLARATAATQPPTVGP